jgi:trans-aconitate methyltransferase
MSAEPGEDYYAGQYLSRLEMYLANTGKIDCIADFGCGQGRLAIPLAKRFPQATVVGVDLSFEALKIANLAADNFELGNIKFIQSPIGNYVVSIAESSLDLAIFTEVAFYLPDWKAILEQIVAKLAPGGILMASFRSTYFTLMLQIRARNFQSAIQILNSGFGRVTPEDDLIFTWVNSSELRNFCEQQGLQLLDLFGIGTSSGIPGDIFDDFAQPGLLIEEELLILEKIENKYSQILPDVGRYVTIIIQKPTI